LGGSAKDISQAFGISDVLIIDLQVIRIFQRMSPANLTGQLYNYYKQSRQYGQVPVSSISNNCSINISTSGTMVRTDEVIILVIVFSLWGGAIALFIHR
jgi:hypothetical protein